VGLAIGDVIGHDLTAASAMAQIRASLRAYAVDGASPAAVINRLDHLVDALGLTQLVTVIYAVLEPVEPDGSRLLRYTNAGHLPPLLREPHGPVRPLAGGDSILIGAPIDVKHSEAEVRMQPGSMLLLYTDGLVEVPGVPLGETLDLLASNVALRDDSTDVERMCDHVLASMIDRDRRDDIALLVVQTVLPRPVESDDRQPGTAHEHA
jgi:serine phosphatase RsbU (regulator of sigma subunit)